MFKRFLVLLILALCAGVARYAYAATFPDVTGSRYTEAYTYLSEKGSVRGYPDGSGRPYDPLNRVEALKVILSLKSDYAKLVQEQQGKVPPLPLFWDTDQRAWYAVYVEVAFKKGLVTGYPDRTFRPGGLLKTEEAIALLLRAYGEHGSSQYAKSSSSMQNRPAEWFTGYVNIAIEKNLISKNEYLRLGSTITRGQFFDLVYRMEIVRNERLAAYNRPEPISIDPVRPIYPSTGSVTTGIYQPIATPNAAVSGYQSNKHFAITIPSLGIQDLTIIHPSDTSSSKGLLAPLKNGLGHLFSYPGGGGKTLIYGHSSSYSWDVSQYTKIFRQINQLNKGDRVYVTYNGKLYTYEVSYEETVAASDTSRYKGEGEELILYTCWPPDSISQRYLVHAVPVK